MNQILRAIFNAQCASTEDGRTLPLQANLPEKAIVFLRTLPHYEDLPLPKSAAGRREMRVRRMMNVPQSRIAAFRKMRADERPPHWHVDF